MQIESLLNIFLYAVIPSVITIGGYFLKNIMNRLDTIEDDVQTKIDEDFARRIIQDKIDPLKEDIKDTRDDIKSIKETVNKLYELQLKNK